MKKLGYVSLFSSAGVGCYGFKQHNFECVATTEIIDRRLKIQKINKVAINDEAYINGDMSLQDTKDKIMLLVEKWTTENRRDCIDVLIEVFVQKTNFTIEIYLLIGRTSRLHTG